MAKLYGDGVYDTSPDSKPLTLAINALTKTTAELMGERLAAVPTLGGVSGPRVQYAFRFWVSFCLLDS